MRDGSNVESGLWRTRSGAAWARQACRMARHRWDPVARPPRELVLPGRLGDPDGPPTRHQASDPLAWRRTSRGYYVPAHVDGAPPEQRVVEQSVRLPPGGAVTGWAGCRLHGAAFFDGLATDGTTLLPVPLALGVSGRVRRDDAVVLSYHSLATDEVTTRRGVPRAEPLRCLLDHVRLHADAREVVVAVDMLAASRVVGPAAAATYAEGLAGRERTLLLWAAHLASEAARSPNETRLRLVAELDAGLPRLWVNPVVHDRSGIRLGEVDLLDVEAGLVIEYDGADHRDAGQHSHDVTKEAGLRGVGLEVTRVTGADLRRPTRLVDRLLAARARARFRAPCPALGRHPSPGRRLPTVRR